MICGPECVKYYQNELNTWCIRGPRRDILFGQSLWPIVPGEECLDGISRNDLMPGDVCRVDRMPMFGRMKVQLLKKTGSDWLTRDKEGRQKEYPESSFYLLPVSPDTFSESGRYKISSGQIGPGKKVIIRRHYQGGEIDPEVVGEVTSPNPKGAGWMVKYPYHPISILQPESILAVVEWEADWEEQLADELVAKLA